MNRLLPLLGLLLLTQPALAQVRKVVSDQREDDLAAAVDVVILSEGYPASAEAEFLEQAGELVRRVRTGQAAAPIRAARPLNFHMVFVSSRDDGAPWQPGAPARKTPFKAHVDEAGDLSTDDEAADVVAAELAPDVDAVVILIRFQSGGPAVKENFVPKRLGSDEEDADEEDADEEDEITGPEDVRANADTPDAGTRVRITPEDPEAFVHELGHALYGLGDEYEEFGALPADEAWEVAACPNLSTEPTGKRWRSVTDTAFEGGGTYAQGVWRPEKHCRMRECRSKLFCSVCQAVIEGSVDPREPTDPTWTAPTAGATIQAAAAGGGLSIASLPLRWRHSGGPAVVYYHLEVRRIGTTGKRGKKAWEEDVESHLRSWKTELKLRKSGRYAIGVTAVNLAGGSETVWTEVEVRAATAGLAGSLGH